MLQIRLCSIKPDCGCAVGLKKLSAQLATEFYFPQNLSLKDKIVAK